ncbi:MAG: beta-N-acetylhexosaminidase [Ferruginibacter sp.]
MKTSCFFLILLSSLLISAAGHSQAKAPANGSPGQGLLPVPQKVSLSDQQYKLDNSWAMETGKVSKDDPAVLSLATGLKERFGLKLRNKGRTNAPAIRLSVQPGAVVIGKTIDTNIALLKKQAYRLKLEPGGISITANAAQGLFYGVQTLLQLLQPVNGDTYYAGGEIVDWPVMDLRMIYWDDAHHLERLDAMKRAIRQASYYKINAFSIKLEGHFQFSAAKPIVEPYAYTPAEYQELTDYAKARYVELVPYLDAPAHISFILKHPEYESLRAFPNSNYELSVTNPKADELMLGMLNELLNANKGGKYMLLSTDEAYYVGMGEGEKKRAQELGGNGKLLAEYITRISNKLHEKGRKVIIWAEYPLTLPDINSLPSHIINGVYNGEWASTIKGHGMRQLIYTSVQGEEQLFPNYHKLPAKSSGNNSKTITGEEQEGGSAKGRVAEALEGITTAVTAGNADLAGVVVAAWADAGLNPETFWLGYAAGSAAGWNNQGITSQDLTSRFYHSFYGNKIVDMDRVYQLLSTQAEFYAKSWEWELSDWRKPIFGNSYAVFDTAKQVRDQTLLPLPVPSATNLALNKDWNNHNKERLELAENYLKENNELMNLLQENMARVDYQQYNLQVLQSVAKLCRQNLLLLLDLKRINDLLSLSSTAAPTSPGLAVSLVDQALQQVKRIRDRRNEVLQDVTAVWYQDWHPRVSEANGRKFLDLADDVKDHRPARTVDMSYLVYRELKYPLGKWADDVLKARNQFARVNNLPERTETLNWETIK